MKAVSGIYLGRDGKVERRTIPAGSVVKQNQYIYEMLGIKWLEIVPRKISGKYVYIICDEEGRLKKNKCTVYRQFGERFLPDIMGNVFICEYEGEFLKSLSAEYERAVMLGISIVDDGTGPRPILITD